MRHKRASLYQKLLSYNFRKATVTISETMPMLNSCHGQSQNHSHIHYYPLTCYIFLFFLSGSVICAWVKMAASWPRPSPSFAKKLTSVSSSQERKRSAICVQQLKPWLMTLNRRCPLELVYNTATWKTKFLH